MRSTSEDSSATPPHHSPNRKWLAMLGIGLGVLMFTLDTSIVNIALPTLVQELRTSFATIQWVVLSYLLVITHWYSARHGWAICWAKSGCTLLV